MQDILQVNMLYRLLSFLCPCYNLSDDYIHTPQGYFDSLRVEIKNDKIDVQLVCPGPIVSNISLNAFSSQLEVCVLMFIDLGLYTHI